MRKESSYTIEPPPPMDARELRGESKTRMLEKRHKVLSIERRGLDRALQKYRYDEIAPLLFPEALGEEVLESIIGEWRTRVRIQTQLFDQLDLLEIDIFTNNLHRQTGFPRVAINFSSPEIARRRREGEKTLVGLSYTDEPRIDIADPMPDMYEQARALLRKGTIHPTVGVLIHELIHQYHRRHSIIAGNAGDKTDAALTEAQAYASGILELGPNYSMADTGEVLGKSKKEGGLYAYDHGKVARALMAVNRLSALGIEERKIGQSIAQSHYDEGKKRFVPLEDSADALYAEYGLTDTDMGALDDLYRKQTHNGRLRAQLLLYETICEMVPADLIQKARNIWLRRHIHMPQYAEGGAPAQERHGQYLVTPVSDDFPWEDIEVEKTGIVFGVFPSKGKKTGEYGIGRLEMREDSDHLVLAQSETDIRHYLDAIREHAPEIDHEDKESFVDSFIRHAAKNPLARRILRAMVSTTEAKEILSTLFETNFREVLEDKSETIRDVSDKLLALRQIRAEEQHRLSAEKKQELEKDISQCYKQLDTIRSAIRRYQSFPRVFNLSVLDVDEKSADLLALMTRDLNDIDTLTKRTTDS